MHLLSLQELIKTQLHVFNGHHTGSNVWKGKEAQSRTCLTPYAVVTQGWWIRLRGVGWGSFQSTCFRSHPLQWLWNGFPGAWWCVDTWINNNGGLDLILSVLLLPVRDGCDWRWVGFYPGILPGRRIDFFVQIKVVIYQPAFGGGAWSSRTSYGMAGLIIHSQS